MKIKRIEITGFKSFVERTWLDFDDGITSIVGPNGCGKSNVVDAIRWVMGEQSARNLRGKLMEDVIFGGSENRKPLGMAEVNLILDNTSGLAPAAFQDFAEIQVTRRLYRNGESEYLLNKTPCRLLDVTELFMDTGVGTRAYSIIEQGKIGMIINSKPEDRRALIEEAAGVTKFKARKKSALRKIEATKQNLLRLNDIITEVRRQMNSLKRQAQKASRYREYKNELRALEVQFALRQYDALLQKIEQASSSTHQQNDQVELANNKLNKAELELEQFRLEHETREKALAQSQESVYKLTSEIQHIESRLEFGEKEIESLGRHHERVQAELAAVERRLLNLDDEEVGLKQSQTNHLSVLAEEESKLDGHESSLSQLVDQEKQLSDELDQARQKLYLALTELTRASTQQEEAERRIATLSELTQRNHQESLGIQNQLQQLEDRAQNLKALLKSSHEQQAEQLALRKKQQDDLVLLRRELEEVESELFTRREECSRQRSRLESLEQLERDREGYARGVKTLLSNPGQKDKLKGLVADLLEPQSEYESAFEAALGERLQTLVPKSFEGVFEAFDYLQQNQSRCTFLLPNKPAVAVPDLTGAQPLLNFLKKDSGSHELATRLLAGIYFVENLEPYYREPVPFGVTLVSRDGYVLNGHGEITGGGRQSLDKGLLHKKREIKSLQSNVVNLEKQVNALGLRRDQLRKDLAAIESALEKSGELLHQNEIHVLNKEKDLEGLQQEEGRLQQRLKVLGQEETQLRDEHDHLDTSSQMTISSRAVMEKDKNDLEAAVERIQDELLKMREEANRVRQQVTGFKVNLASLQERVEGDRIALERLGNLREELLQRNQALKDELVETLQTQSNLRSDIEGLKTDMESLYKDRIAQEESFVGLKERYEESRAQIDKCDSELKHLRSQAQQLRDELSSRQLAGKELQMEIEHMLQSFFDKHRIDLSDSETQAQFDENFDVDNSSSRLEFLKKRIDEIGDVNLMAIDEYQELEERYVFMTEQQEDLQKSLEGLQSAIAKINRTTRKRFRETFDQVNATFQQVFPRLFNGGQADLLLTDENDLLETGIDVVAQPPGKKLQNVTLLSGGEKALTAVALIFSIFMIKPSPFCLLDEVDAPLDDANIGRFNEIVGEMTQSSQFIIITHNKRTMEIADNLYGITMEEPGVSKLVSVRLKEVA